MTVVATVCSGCGKPTKEAVKGRCPECAPAHELERKRVREERDPWSRLYSLAVWKKCRAFVLERDDHRCRLRISPACKPNGPRLRAHHSPRAARELWTMARGVWQVFVELACDPDGVITACEPCDALDDARRRAAASRVHPPGLPLQKSESVGARDRALARPPKGGVSSGSARRAQSAPPSENVCTGLGVRT